jgi:DNA polymerase elongation subunit (family B)
LDARGRQCHPSPRARGFVGVIVGTHLRTSGAAVAAALPFDTITEATNTNLSSPLVYSPMYHLKHRGIFPSGPATVIKIRSKEPSSHLELGEYRKYILNNEIQLGVHLGAAAEEIDNISLYFLCMFNKAPYGWFYWDGQDLSNYNPGPEESSHVLVSGPPAISLLSLDIECLSPKHRFPNPASCPIVCIGMITGTVNLISGKLEVAERIMLSILGGGGGGGGGKATFTIPGASPLGQAAAAATPTTVTTVSFPTELSMLLHLMTVFAKTIIINGFNSTKFDLPYIAKRLIILDPSMRWLSSSSSQFRPSGYEVREFFDGDIGSIFGAAYTQPQWQKIKPFIAMPHNIILDTLSLVISQYESTFKQCPSKGLSDVAKFMKFEATKLLPPDRADVVNMSTVELLATLDGTLIHPYCFRDVELAIAVFLKTNQGPYLLHMSIAGGMSLERVLEINVSSRGATTSAAMGITTASFIPPYRFVHNGCSALGRDYAIVSAQLWQRRKAKYTNSSSAVTQRANSDDDGGGGGGGGDEAVHTVVGATVLAPIAGIHVGLFALDLASLYPSIQKAFNMGPGSYFRVTLAQLVDLQEEAKRLGFPFEQQFYTISCTELLQQQQLHDTRNPEDWIIFSIYGQYSPFPAVQSQIMQMRGDVKTQIATLKASPLPHSAEIVHQLAVYAGLQAAIKTIANAAYGVLLAIVLKETTNPTLGAATTCLARIIMRLTVAFLNNKLGYQIMYGDTDSVFIPLKGPSSTVSSSHQEANRVCSLVNAHLCSVFPFIQMRDSPQILRFEMEKVIDVLAQLVKKKAVMVIKDQIFITGLSAHSSTETKDLFKRLVGNILSVRKTANYLWPAEQTQKFLQLFTSMYQQCSSDPAYYRQLRKTNPNFKPTTPYMKRILFLKAQSQIGSTVEFVSIISDFNVGELNAIENIRLGHEMRGGGPCYTPAAKQLLFSSDRQSILECLFLERVVATCGGMPSEAEKVAENKKKAMLARKKLKDISEQVSARCTDLYLETNLSRLVGVTVLDLTFPTPIAMDRFYVVHHDVRTLHSLDPGGRIWGLNTLIAYNNRLCDMGTTLSSYSISERIKRCGQERKEHKSKYINWDRIPGLYVRWTKRTKEGGMGLWQKCLGNKTAPCHRQNGAGGINDGDLFIHPKQAAKEYFVCWMLCIYQVTYPLLEAKRGAESRVKRAQVWSERAKGCYAKLWNQSGPNAPPHVVIRTSFGCAKFYGPKLVEMQSSLDEISCAP